jgi:hypothetical protein
MKVISAFFCISLAILVVACSKDKYETKPRLEIKDYSAKEVFPGQELRIRLNYYDKEGDINGAWIVGIRDRLNLFPLGPNDDRADTFPNPNNPVFLPDFPSKDHGEITFQLPYETLKESQNENDTIIFRFAITDKAGNKSDTITSDKIVVIL